MKQRIIHGAVVDALTPDELVNLIPRPPVRKRVRIPESIQLSGTGAGGATVWDVPAAMSLEIRRVVLTLTGPVPSDPNTGNVLLNAAGHFVALMRGDLLIEYLQPAYGAAIQVPGVQTWSREQGPELTSKEQLAITAAGLTANAVLSVYVEGFLEDRSGRRFHAEG